MGYVLVGVLFAVVGALYHYRFSLFKRCDMCQKWAWQTTPIHEFTTGAVCDTCRYAELEKLYQTIRERN